MVDLKLFKSEKYAGLFFVFSYLNNKLELLELIFIGLIYVVRDSML